MPRSAESRAHQKKLQKEWSHRMYATNPEYRAMKAGYDQRRNREVKRDCLNSLGGACACCGETTLEFLTLDHIGGWGKYHRKIKRGGGGIYREVLRQGSPSDMYQVLCMNCNFVTRLGKECPHQTGVRQLLQVAAG